MTPFANADSTMSPDDFDPYSSYFNLEQYFKSFDVTGSYSYSAFDAGYESFGAREGQIYRCYYTFGGYELAITYTDQEELWSYDSGKITIYDDENGDIIASFSATGDKERTACTIRKRSVLRRMSRSIS